jgi:hypothetical protein
MTGRDRLNEQSFPFRQPAYVPAIERTAAVEQTLKPTGITRRPRK